jgi:hypothetical protein
MAAPGRDNENMYWPIIYIVTVVLAALTDEVDHQKGAETLYDLWHLLRDLTWIGIFFIGYTFELYYPWWSYIMWLVMGWFFWEGTYAQAKQHAFHRYDDTFVMPLGKYLTILGFGRRRL